MSAKRPGQHVGATAALVQHLRRARQLAELLDCHVQPAFEGDDARLAEWRTARRVQSKTSARRGDHAAPVVEGQEMEPLKLVAAA